MTQMYKKGQQKLQGTTTFGKKNGILFSICKFQKTFSMRKGDTNTIKFNMNNKYNYRNWYNLF